MTVTKVTEKIPVIAFSTQEFIGWLTRKKYSKRDYEHVTKLSEIRNFHSRVFVILPGAMERKDWPKINDYFLLNQPALIVE